MLCCIQVTDVMKFVADLWRQSSDQEKKYWEEVSLKDKERYQQELANYKGPLKVTSKRLVGLYEECLTFATRSLF